MVRCWHLRGPRTPAHLQKVARIHHLGNGVSQCGNSLEFGRKRSDGDQRRTLPSLDQTLEVVLGYYWSMNIVSCLEYSSKYSRMFHVLSLQRLKSLYFLFRFHARRPPFSNQACYFFSWIKNVTFKLKQTNQVSLPQNWVLLSVKR